jgi:quercetin dioxygenase-like cupin family protein
MEPTIVDLLRWIRENDGSGPIWTHTSEDLNVNLLRFHDGAGVPAHINDQLDVLVVVIEGEGIVEVDGEQQRLATGQACLIPKGATRSLRSDGGAFSYLSCHRRRGGLWPA